MAYNCEIRRFHSDKDSSRVLLGFDAV